MTMFNSYVKIPEGMTPWPIHEGLLLFTIEAFCLKTLPPAVQMNLGMFFVKGVQTGLPHW